MKVTLLPSTTSGNLRHQALTAYLVDSSLAVDAGSIGIALDRRAMGNIRFVVITHAHIDHIATLPLLVSELFDMADSALPVYALPEVIQVLRENIFNGAVWPNFEQIELPNGHGPALEFRELDTAGPTQVGDYFVRAIRMNHTVPTAGLIVEKDGVAVGFTADTYMTDEFWEVANSLTELRSVFVDVSFPDAMEALAATALHHTPNSLAKDLTKLTRRIDVFAVHLKPGSQKMVQSQLEQLEPPVAVAEIGFEYEWTTGGDSSLFSGEGPT